MNGKRAKHLRRTTINLGASPAGQRVVGRTVEYPPVSFVRIYRMLKRAWTRRPGVAR